MRRIALVRFVRQQLGLTIEGFAEAYGIPADVVRTWERHEAEPTAAEMSFLKAIARAPDAVRKALTAA
jgi:putative transcriptional regulator